MAGISGSVAQDVRDETLGPCARRSEESSVEDSANAAPLDKPTLKLRFMFQLFATRGFQASIRSWIGDIHYVYRIEDDIRCCCRYKPTKRISQSLSVSIHNELLGGLISSNFNVKTEKVITNSAWNSSEEKYVIVGIRNSDHSAPRERVLRISSDEDMFKKVQVAINELRPIYRRLFSLKSISGFGVYECFPDSDDHAPSQLDREDQRALAIFFAAFRSGRDKKSSSQTDRWVDWIHTRFNCESVDPTAGKLTLEFKLDWSAPKFIFWGVTPILLSFAIGLWYMLKPLEEGADYIAVVQTGWTIASYIVTAAAVLLGVLAATTQFGDV